jgi:predicted CXXCH cytochrome family protein
MTCSTCHTIHTSENLMADRDAQIENCAQCHAAQIEAHDRFEGHGILFDRLTCHDCHDVHQLMRRE